MPTVQPTIPAQGTTPQFAASQQMQSTSFRLADGDTRQIPIQGQWLYIKELYRTADASSSDDVLIASDLCGPLPFNVGTGFRYRADSQFRFLELRNPAGNGEIFIEITAGYGDYIDNRLNIVRTRPAAVQPVVDQLSDPIGTGVTSIAAAGTESLTGVPPAGYSQRKAVVISNLDPNLPLYLRDSAGDVVGVVFAEQTQIYFFSGACQVHNPGGAAVACFIGEIWNLPQSP